MGKSIFYFLFLFFFFITSYAKNIYVVESYHAEYQWDSDYKAGLESVLGSGNKITYFQMDTKRIPKSEQQKMADLAWDKYNQIKPDVVVLGDDAALKLLGPRLSQAPIPVVFLGINGNPRTYFKDSKIPMNMTGVLERPIFKRAASSIEELLPGAKKGLLIFDTDLTSQAVKSEIFENKDSMDLLGVNFELKLIGDQKTLESTVQDAKGKYDFIIAGLYQTVKDSSGTVVNPDTVVSWISQNSPVPVFGFWDFSIGKNMAIGGLVLYGKDMGIAAGKMVLKILSGTDPKSISIAVDNQGVFLFSKTQLEKWKIKLPEDIQKSARIVE